MMIIPISTKETKNEKLEIVFSEKVPQNCGFEIAKGVSEITLKGAINKFDIITNSGSEITINLDNNISISIKNGDGEVTINGISSSKKVNLNKVWPVSNNFKIIAKNPIEINILDFNSTQSLLVEPDENANVEIKTVKVQQNS